MIFESYSMYAVGVRMLGGGDDAGRFDRINAQWGTGGRQVPHFRGWNRAGFDDDVRGFRNLRVRM